MSLFIDSLLRSLAGRPQKAGPFALRRKRPESPRRHVPTLLATESLESRAMLAVTINIVGTVLQVTQDPSVDATIGVDFSVNPFKGATGPVQASAVTINGTTAAGSPILTNTAQAFNDPVTGLPVITSISISMNMTQPTTNLVVNDTLSGITNVTGGGSWTVSYAIAGVSAASGTLNITNPSKLAVTTNSSVGIDGSFINNTGYLRVAPGEAVIGKTADVQAQDVTITTAAGTKAITMLRKITGTNSVTLSTKSTLFVARDIIADSVTLDVPAGASQSGGIISAATISLSSAAAVTLNNSSNAISNIAAINATGQDVVINTTNSVTQTGNIRARSLQLEAIGSVTLNTASNDLDQVAISSSGGAISYTDFDELSLGVGTLGISTSGSGPVTLTTRGNLTQSGVGSVVASTFTANILAPASGNANLLLNSANNMVDTFIATNASASGGITLVNTAVSLVLGDGTSPGGISASNGPISISNGNAIRIASPVSAGSLGTISLTSKGAISQDAAAILTAQDLTVVNNDATGEVNLGLLNDVRNVAITNNASASAGITFTGSNAATGSLAIGVGGTGIVAQGGVVRINANGRKMAVNAPIMGNGATIQLTAALGVLQLPAAGIVAGDLTVTNATAGEVLLQSPNNDVANLAIQNNVTSGTVKYADKNDLSLTAGGGIVAGDSITVTVGGGFTSTPGNVLQVTGPTGKVSLTTAGTALIGGAVTGQSGVIVTAGSDVTLSAALDGGGVVGPVTLTAAGVLATKASGTVSGTSVALSGNTSVNLADQVTATAGITIDSINGPLTTTLAATLTATSIVSKTIGAATFGGTVTATDAINITAGGLTNLSDINVNAAFIAGGGLSLDAFGAITTLSTITGASVTGKSIGATTLGGAISSTAGLIAFTAGTSFTAAVGSTITGIGNVDVTSDGIMSLADKVLGPQVTLSSGTLASPGGVNLLESVTASTGSLSITAIGGAVTIGTLAKIDAVGGISIIGDTGVTVAAAATGGSVNVTAASGAVLVSAVTASTSVLLSAANGVAQALPTVITAGSLTANNSTAGDILLREQNAVSIFAAVNSAPAGDVLFTNSLPTTLTGVAAANGDIVVTVNGAITATGSITAGTGTILLEAAGSVGQSATAAITGSSLEVNTSGGGVLLGTCLTNDVDFLFGRNTNSGGVFEFTDMDGLGLTTANKNLFTNDGNITVASGQPPLLPGVMTIGGIVRAGAGFITLQATGGITGLVGHQITTTDGLQLANNTSGNIVLSGLGNSYPTLSAATAAGGNITLFDNQTVTLINNGLTAGISALGGSIELTVQGSVDQDADAPIIANNATFLAVGAVLLDGSPINDVANLAIQNTGPFTQIQYTDANDLAIGVGGIGVVSTFADITVTSLVGGLTLNAQVSTSDLESIITLNAGGGSITQTADSITTGELVMGSTNDIFVQQTGNVITNLRATASNQLRYVNSVSFEAGLDRISVNPDLATTVGVSASIATFSQAFTVTLPGGIRRGLIPGDVLVINTLPYRVLNVPSPTTASLIPTDGLPINYPAGTAFTVLTPQVTEVAAADVNLNCVVGTLRVTAGIAAGIMTLTAGDVVEYAVSSTENALGGSLRQMIEYANVNLGTRTANGVTASQPMQIVFNESLYPVQDIFVTSALPAVQKPVDIIGEAVEQNVTDYARVGIDGTGITATSIVHGLRYAAGSQGSRVTGLAMYGFDTGAGFRIVSGLNTFANNYAGVERNGTTLSGNKIGFELSGQTATTNTIGTYVADEALANVIGGNTYAGIVARSGATANAIVGNYIGTDSRGAVLSNLGDGVVFEGVNGNIIGARSAVLPDGTPAASNTIANNNNSGIRIVGSRAATLALGNLIENNLIQANAINGVEIIGSTFQNIGGIQPRQANVITGQVTGSGIRIAQSSDVSVVANYLGTNAAGTAGLGNFESGVMIDRSVRTIVNAGNRIVSNGTGVTIRNSSTATRVEGNWIGTDSVGTQLGNKADGVRIDRSIGNFVRLGNTIANNSTNGINITDSTAATLAQGNLVTGNLITANGTSSTGSGIRVSGGARHSIGQTGGANVITSNQGEGIRVDRSPLTGASVSVLIQGNYIGTNANEETDSSLGNNVGIRLSQASSVIVNGRNVIANNVGDGILLEGTLGSQVGAGSTAMGNVISGNTGNGITITSTVGTPIVRSRDTNIFGNQISGNTQSGVLVKGTTNTNGVSTTSNVVIGLSAIPGKPVAGAANAIFGNRSGVTIDGAQGVLVASNSIYDNIGLPIEIINDGNRGATAPTLARAVFVQRSNSLSQVVVQGTFAEVGLGTATVINGTVTFSDPQPLLTVGAVVVLNGTGYRVAQKTSVTVFRLVGNPTLTTAGVGRVAATKGVSTFSVAQLPSLVGQSIIVAGRSYTVTSLSANGRTGSLAGAPTFAVGGFSLLQPVAFSWLNASLLNQQFVVDIFLNDPGDGDTQSGTGYGMRTFIGRATVTIGPTGTGRFTATVNLPAGISAIGQYVTATATTVRASGAVSPFSTSQVSTRARQLVFAGQNP